MACYCRGGGWSEAECNELVVIERRYRDDPDDGLEELLDQLRRYRTNVRTDPVFSTRHFNNLTIKHELCDEYMRVGLLPTTAQACLMADNLRYFEICKPSIAEIYAAYVENPFMWLTSECLLHYFKYYRHESVELWNGGQTPRDPPSAVIRDPYCQRELLTFRTLTWSISHCNWAICNYDFGAGKVLDVVQSRHLNWVDKADPGTAAYPLVMNHMVMIWGTVWVNLPQFAHLPKVQAYQRDPVGFIRENDYYVIGGLSDQLLLFMTLIRAKLLRARPNTKAQRFFKIACDLPLELQHRLCRVAESCYFELPRMVSSFVYGPAYRRAWYMFLARET